MRRFVLYAPLVLLLACTKEETDTDADTNEDSGDTGPKEFDDFINVTTEATGTFTCHADGDPWIVETPNPANQSTGSATALVSDFESGDPVDEASITVWYGDDVTGTPDTTGVSGSEGTATMTLPVCQAFSYKTYTNPELERTKDTFEAHQVLAPGDGGVTELNSVSDTTYKIIPSLLGVSVDADKGVIAGTAFDCDSEKIENAQVILVDAAGAIPQSLVVHYFVDDFPNRDQPDTSPDGLWVAVNVPPGVWTAQVWGVRSGVLELIGETVVKSSANSINIANVYAGHDDGIKYPAECLQSPG